MSELFQKPKSLGEVKFKLDLSNYATKRDLKNEDELIDFLLLKKLI